MRRVLVLIIVASLPFAQAGSGDAGTGQDAPGTEAQAALLPGEGTYVAGLSKEDVDWFRAPDAASQPLCVDLSLTSQVATTQSLVIGSTRATLERLSLENGRAAIAGVATAARIGVVNTQVPKQSGDYGFTFTTLRAADVTQDTGTTGDAPAQLANAVAIAPGCMGGVLGGISSLDSADAFAFTAGAGNVTLLTLSSTAPADMRLDLARADGSLLGSITPGQALQVALPQTGTYYMTASSVSVVPSQYTVGLVVGPPGQGCRPACISI